MKELVKAMIQSRLSLKIALPTPCLSKVFTREWERRRSLRTFSEKVTPWLRELWLLHSSYRSCKRQFVFAFFYFDVGLSAQGQKQKRAPAKCSPFLVSSHCVSRCLALLLA